MPETRNEDPLHYIYIYLYKLKMRFNDLAHPGATHIELNTHIHMRKANS